MDQILYIAAALAAVTAAVAALARRLDWPAPVLLVTAGLGLALTPGLPRVELPPDLVLLVFLPPIIYNAAFGISWQAFCANLRPIALLAVGCVLATTIAVAAASHWLFGMAWSVAFVLGAIVSPPDVVAPLAIARRLGIPARISAVLEGEGLVNDATALVLFDFALTAVITGSFSIVQATATFGAVVVGETLYGLAIGWTMLSLRRLAGDPRIEVTLSLLTPFLAFWVPRTFGGSGVLATVVAGLYVGTKGVAVIPSSTRLQALFFWDFVTYVVTGAIFLLTGLQARTVLESLDGAPLGRLMLYGVAVSLVAIAVRFLWVFSVTYMPRWLVPSLAKRDRAPPWPYPFMVAFTGVRGVVSLAAALSIPFTIGPDRAFPDRGLILFLTFSVIVVTLVLQGPTLPFVVRRLGLVEAGQAERRQRAAQQADAELEAARVALEQLARAATQQTLPSHLLEPIRYQHEQRIRNLERRRDLDGDGAQAVRQTEAIELALVEAERAHVNELGRVGAIPDEVRRRIERDLDLREERLRHNVQGVSEDGEA